MHTVSDSVGLFPCGHITVNVFSSMNKMLPTSVDECYFSVTVSNAESCMATSFHSALVHGDFCAQTFSVAKRLTCVGILLP